MIEGRHVTKLADKLLLQAAASDRAPGTLASIRDQIYGIQLLAALANVPNEIANHLDSTANKISDLSN